MSQNKTKVPGLGNTKRGFTTSVNTNSQTQSTVYQPSEPLNENSTARTHISGMYAPEIEEKENNKKTNSENSPKRTLAAIMFSISNNGSPELFPLYLGRNIIGRSANADIQLNEETVSVEHAVIVIRHITQPSSRFVMSITDTNSSMGTFLNNECIDYDTHVIENMDKIRFGASYEFAVLKLDPEELKLKAALSFKSTDIVNEQSRIQGHTEISSKPSQTPTLEGVGHNNSLSPYAPSKKNNDKTVIA